MKTVYELSAIAVLAVSATTLPVLAGEMTKARTIKPLAAVTFAAGARHGVGYFYNADKRCKLVVTVAEEPNWDQGQTFTATRTESDVPVGATTRYASSEGKVLEFTCISEAREMSVKEVERVVSKNPD